MNSNEGTAARNEAMQRILDNAKEEWKAAVMQRIIKLPEGWTGTGEDIRLLCPPAHHPNAWGAMIGHAVRKKLIKHTGQYCRSKALSSHAAEIRIYKRTNI